MQNLENMADLFEDYNEQPQELKEVLSKYNLDELTYKDCKQMLEKVEAIGFTFEYYLNAEPFNLHKIKP